MRQCLRIFHRTVILRQSKLLLKGEREKERKREKDRGKISDESKRALTSSTLRLGMWKNDRSSLSLTCVCRSGKQSLMFRSTSALSCEQIELPVQLSFDVPSLLCSHNDVSLSLTFAILESFTSSGRRTSPWRRHRRFPPQSNAHARPSDFYRNTCMYVFQYMRDLRVIPSNLPRTYVFSFKILCPD